MALASRMVDSIRLPRRWKRGGAEAAPPVRRTPVMPRSVATRSTVMSSSVESTSGPGRKSAKSAGMQYVQRRLHRSVRDTRRSLW